LGVVVAGAFVVRLVYVLVHLRHDLLGGDSPYYSLQGHDLAHGRWFIEPFRFRLDHVTEPSAYHPPLFSLYLGLVSRLGADSVLAHRVAACLVGAAAVGAIGLLGRRLAGDRAGIVAAGIAALYPFLWINDAVVLSESLLALTTALTLLAAYAFWRAPSPRRAAALGAGIALVALTRAEGALLFALLGVPVVLMGAGTRVAPPARADCGDGARGAGARRTVGRIQPGALRGACVPVDRIGRDTGRLEL